MELQTRITSNYTMRIHMPMEHSSIQKRVEEAEKSVAEKSELSEAEQRTVQELKEIDRAVRAHEQAHMNGGGGVVTGSPSYVYQTGPDGKQYAVGGEVHIDSREVPGDPEATLEKMEQVRRAALAPANPSDQDQRIAAQAASKAAKARMEIQKQKQIENDEKLEQQSPEKAALLKTAAQSYSNANSPFGSGKLLNLTA